MILQALDTIHVSAVSSDNIITGQVFEIHDLAGKSLIERGLAIKVDVQASEHAGQSAQVQQSPQADLGPLGPVAEEGTAPATPIAKKAGANLRTKAE